MADSFIQIAADSTGKKLDTRTEGTNTEHRQVVVLGDPATNTGVAPVDATNGLSVNVTNASLTVGTHAVTQSGTWTVNPTTASNWGIGSSTQNSASVANGQLALAQFNTTPTTITSGNMSPLQMDSAGNLLVNIKAGAAAGGTSSTVGAAAPSTATAVGFTDGTNMVLAKVRGASTGAAVATDPALVVTIRDANANGSATSANSAPVVIASDQAAVKVTPGVSATSNGATPSRINAAASTNATSLKASGGQAYGIDVFNVAAYNVFLKLYNKASAPTVGTDTPFMTIPVAAGGGVSLRWVMGLPMTTGIAYAITKLQADSDTTAVAAGDLTGLMLWI